MGDDTDRLREELAGRLEAVLDHYWPGWIKRGVMAHPVPGKAKGDLGSFSVYLAPRGKYRRGDWVRSSQGVGGDVINLFAYGDSGMSDHRAKAATFAAAKAFLGWREESSEEREEREERARRVAAKRKAEEAHLAAEAEREARRKTATAAGLLKASVPLRGTLGEDYLCAMRGIPRPPQGWPDQELRFVAEAGYEWIQGARFPAVIGRVRDVDGKTTGVWRIFLDPSLPPGTKGRIQPPPGCPSKAGLGPAQGGAVRIGGAGARIGVSEGIESALAAWAMVQWRFPVWALMSATNMEQFDVPPEVTRIDGFGDGDIHKIRGGKLMAPRGQQAMEVLAERLGPAGIQFVKQPTMWNGDPVDILNRVGADLWRDRVS